MKSHSFSPAIDALENRTVLSGISSVKFAQVDEAFKVFQATEISNSQHLMAAAAANPTLAADQLAIATDKSAIYDYFIGLAQTTPSATVNLPLIQNLLFVSNASGVTLGMRGYVDYTVPGATQLILDQAQLRTDQAAAVLDPNGDFTLQSDIDTLATTLSTTLGASKSALIRADITGASTAGGVLLATSPAKGSLAYDLTHASTETFSNVQRKFEFSLLFRK